MKRKILLTGDSKGLGFKTRIKLEQMGFEVIGLSRNSLDIKFDLSHSDQIKKLYIEKLKDRGPFFGYINNAAYAYDDIVTNANQKNIEKMFRVNVISPIMLTKYMIRDMILNKTEGRFVHISSISVRTGYKGLSMYASTKGAIEAFSKNVAREWGKFNIISNVISPGFMDTDMSSSLNNQQREKIFKRNSLHRELDIESVVNSIGFLMGKESNGITGQTINVDNGTI